jgi:hypothetical protein
MEERRFDLRTLERSLMRGKITQDEYETFLKGLGDVSENCEPITVSIDGDDDEEELEGDEATPSDEDAPPSEDQAVEAP